MLYLNFLNSVFLQIPNNENSGDDIKSTSAGKANDLKPVISLRNLIPCECEFVVTLSALLLFKYNNERINRN